MSKQELKRQEISEGHDYVTSENWTFDLEDSSHQFGLYIETVDMYDATGEKEYKNYPYLVSVSIVADKPHKSFAEAENRDGDKLSRIYDMFSYMGGVPVDHTLTDGVRDSREEPGEAFDVLAKQFNVKEACIVSNRSDFGTVAAQRGRGSEFSHLQFKTPEAAAKYVDYLLKYRCGAISMLIGFILDRPINMAGDSGWSVMEQQVKGCK